MCTARANQPAHGLSTPQKYVENCPREKVRFMSCVETTCCRAQKRTAVADATALAVAAMP